MTTSNMNLSLTISAVDQASAVVQQIGGAIQQMASGNVVGAVMDVGSAIVGIGAQATQMAGQYQQSFNMIQSLTGASSQQMAQYNAQLQQLAVEAGSAPNELAQGLYNVMSAGYSGSDAMRVLTLATEDSKIGMTDATTTTNALTNVMKSFGVQASDATRVNGEMLATVTAGKSTFAQYATSITTAASTSVQFHESMETMNAAWATLTSSGISAAHATTDYDQSLRIMDGNIGTVAKSLNSSGIAFSEAKFNALDYGGKVQMLNTALDKAASMHVKVTGATQQGAQAIQTIAKNISTYNSDLSTFSNRAAMAQKTQQAWAITSQGFNQKMSQLNAAFQVLMISLGNKLLPALGKIVGAITPVIVAFTNWVNGSHQVNGVIAQIGGVLQSLFLPVWQQLVTLFQTQIVPMWGQLRTAIQPMMPVLQSVAVIVGSVIYGAFVLLISIIRAVIGAFSGLLTGVVVIVQGISNFIAGGVGAWSASIQFFTDLVTGNFNALGTDLGNIWHSILQMMQGVWQAIVGVAVSAVNALIGLLNGFIAGVVSGINAILSAAHQATISAPTIGMLNAPAIAAGNFANYAAPTASQAQGVTPQQQAQSNAGLSSILSQLQSLGNQQGQNNVIAQANQVNTANLGNTANNLNNSTIPNAANTAAAANSSGHAKTAAQIAKAADTANAQRLKLAADQQKALTASDSPAVQALINQSKAAAAKGDTATAAFYASQADTLANQQKAATVKAAKAAATAAHHKAVLAAAAERKAQASKNHAEIMAARAAAQKAKAASKAANATLKAARHKQTIQTILNAANQIANPQATQATAVIAATAAGVILPDYLAGTAYTAYNAQPQAAATGNTTINVTVASGSNDPKAHGKAVADEVNKHLAKRLRQSSTAPRYTKGGSHH